MLNSSTDILAAKIVKDLLYDLILTTTLSESNVFNLYETLHREQWYNWSAQFSDDFVKFYQGEIFDFQSKIWLSFVFPHCISLFYFLRLSFFIGEL